MVICYRSNGKLWQLLKLLLQRPNILISIYRDKRLEGGISYERVKEVQINFIPSTNDGVGPPHFARKEEFYKQKHSGSLKLRRVWKGRAQGIFGGLNEPFCLTLALVQFISMFREIEAGLEAFVSWPPDPSLVSPTNFAEQTTVLRLPGPATCATGTSWHSYKWLLGVLGTYPSLLPLHFFFLIQLQLSALSAYSLSLNIKFKSLYPTEGKNIDFLVVLTLNYLCSFISFACKKILRNYALWI